MAACSSCSVRGVTARGPDRTLIVPEPSHSCHRRSASASEIPKASMNSDNVERLSSLPDRARETVSLSWCGSTSTSPGTRG